MISARRLTAWTITVLLVSPACAADLDVQVRSMDGAPVRDAVVAVHLVGDPTPPARPTGGYAVDQQNIQFHPFVTIVPVGSTVSFLNHDPVRHHVYSFSPAKLFELKLERRQQNRSVLFDAPGIVPLGCNIHDRMIAFIDVVDTPWAVKTDANGNARLHGLPAASVTIDVWHPYARLTNGHTERQALLASGAAHREQFAIPLRPPPRPPTNSDY